MNAGREVRRFEWRDTPRWVRILALVALVNFVLYVIIAGTHGGDAWNGYRKDGRYFVSEHGRITEVSRAFWTYSYYHTIFLWITHLSTMAAFGFYYFVSLRRQTV